MQAEAALGEAVAGAGELGAGHDTWLAATLPTLLSTLLVLPDSPALPALHLTRNALRVAQVIRTMIVLMENGVQLN